MTKIIYIEHSGTEHVVDAQDGKSIMQTALDHSVPGIVGDCGGCCSCATCHGYIDTALLGKIPVKTEVEEMLLDGALEVQANSRLTCQIVVEPGLDGLIIRLPKSQV
jgi:2Fe-2S ferredoxin